MDVFPYSKSKIKIFSKSKNEISVYYRLSVSILIASVSAVLSTGVL